MSKLIFVFILALQTIGSGEQGLEMLPATNCAENKCDIVLGDTLPDSFKVCIDSDVRCISLGSLRRQVK